MASSNPTPLAFPPIQVPVVDDQKMMTQAWAMWFQQMYVRIGGTTTVPDVPATRLVLGSPFDFYLVPAGPSVVWNGRTYSAGQIIPFYQSGISASTVITSFIVRNTALTAGTVNVWVVPMGQLPSDANLVVNAFPLPLNSAAVTLTQLTGTEFGSGAYLAVTASPSQQIICELSGRILS